jgi:hypothetical protein
MLRAQSKLCSESRRERHGLAMRGSAGILGFLYGQENPRSRPNFMVRLRKLLGSGYAETPWTRAGESGPSAV